MAHCQLAKAPYWTFPVMSQITKEASLPTNGKGSAEQVVPPDRREKALAAR